MDKERLKRLIFGELSIKRLLRSMILIPICIYIFFFFYALIYSDNLIFQPHPSGYRDNDEIIKLTTKDGVKISALFLKNPDAQYTILYSHGNGEDISDLIPLFKDISKSGFNLFAYDYHGYGTSNGKPTESNTYLDIDAAYEYLTTKLNISPKQIIAYGRSVGGGPTVDLASRKEVGGLIVESSFITAFRVLTRIPILPFDKFRNLQKISKVHCPVLIIHGKKDSVISFNHGQKLFDNANEPKQYLWIENADHNDLTLVAGDRYLKALKDFSMLLGH
jgi:abhydrolase domain-containing protein 17